MVIECLRRQRKRSMLANTGTPSPPLALVSVPGPLLLPRPAGLDLCRDAERHRYPAQREGLRWWPGSKRPSGCTTTSIRVFPSSRVVCERRYRSGASALRRRNTDRTATRLLGRLNPHPAVTPGAVTPGAVTPRGCDLLHRLRLRPLLAARLSNTRHVHAGWWHPLAWMDARLRRPLLLQSASCLRLDGQQWRSVNVDDVNTSKITKRGRQSVSWCGIKTALPARV